MGAEGRERLRAERSVWISRDAASVFGFVTDLPRTPTWRTSVKHVEMLDAEPLDLGVRFAASTHVLGKRWSWVMEITDWDPPRRFGYRVVEGRVRIDVAYVCTPDDGGCRFTMVGSAHRPSGWFGVVVAPFAARVMERDLGAHLAKLKSVLEGDVASRDDSQP
jgi:uncharacterized membrane protein